MSVWWVRDAEGVLLIEAIALISSAGRQKLAFVNHSTTTQAMYKYLRTRRHTKITGIIGNAERFYCLA